MTRAEIDAAAKQFKEDFLAGGYIKDTSPNRGKHYHDEVEQLDYKAFQEYLASDLFKEINGIKQV